MGRFPQSDRRNLVWGFLFVSPWFIGLLLFLVYPVVASFRLSLLDYSGFGNGNWIGFANYLELFHDPAFWTSVYNTLFYVALAVPLGVVTAILLAVAMNQRVRESNLYRVLIYLPSVVPVFALSLMMVWLLNPRYGLVNFALSWLQIPAVDWLGDPHWAKIALVLTAQFGAGQIALIFLAAIRAIPRTLYDAAQLDGAGRWHSFCFVTLPLITPAILYDIIIGIGLGLQAFVPAYIMTEGGPLNSTTFTALYIYKNAFEYSRFGFASAAAGVLFLMNVILALAVFQSARFWVRYHLE